MKSLRRLWHWITTPSGKIAAGVLLLAGVVVGIVGWGGFNTAMEATNSLEFCISCHEMRDTVYQEYKKSIHYSNPAGVRAICSDCHVPKEWTHKVIRKIQASGELWGKFTGVISTPEKFEEHRLSIAKWEWARMKANDSRECRNCHSFEAMDFAHQRPKAAETMQKAFKEGGTCIDCHKGIAHHLPDMSSGYKGLFSELKSSAAKTAPKVGDVLYAITTKPIFIDRPSDAKATADGRLIAATPVKVLKVDGDWLQVEVGGWQQQGAERMIYAHQGQRIFAAALGAPAVEKVQQGQSVTDPNTDQVWAPATLTAWTAKDNLVPDLNQLWAYSQEMYGAACGACHSAHAASHFLANQWIGTFNGMRPRTSLDDEEARLLQKYLQLHAKDSASASDGKTDH